jgi:hypothetical protein
MLPTACSHRQNAERAVAADLGEFIEFCSGVVKMPSAKTIEFHCITSELVQMASRQPRAHWGVK